MRIKALVLASVIGAAALFATPRAEAQRRHRPRPNVDFQFDVGYRPHAYRRPHYRRPGVYYNGGNRYCPDYGYDNYTDTDYGYTDYGYRDSGYTGYGYQDNYSSRYCRPRDRWIPGSYDACGLFVPGHWEYYR